MPTQENLKKIEFQKQRNNLQGSIMNSIFTEIDHKKAAKSVAHSNRSVFSSMRPGAFFKVVDSPFKFGMMSCYDRMN